MGETEHIAVAETSEGVGSAKPAGETVSLPVVELLTGRGFVTGKSGSGKSNSASVIAEQLLDNGFGLLIVDVDGEYYGLKEEYEILHVGADEECDIQVTTEHAEKLSSLALEQNVPIILDVSSFIDESEAEDLLTAVARSLFAKAKKQKQPFLLLVEEVHEYIPEQGAVGECGRMLIKIGKRGRKHGLGICGISQRPADVKKDFITQCDWLLWHRLTWKNDTQVVRRILDGEYAEAVESLDDGEGFLVTDWSGDVRRVQFYRKETFDAGATPGLDDFERPDLKSVSEDLVSELAEISNEAAAHDDRIAELRAQLDEKNSRIAELERELKDARDLRDLAEQFVTALTARGEAAGLTEREKLREHHSADRPEQTPRESVGWPGGWREEETETTLSGGDTTHSNESAEAVGAGVGAMLEDVAATSSAPEPTEPAQSAEPDTELEHMNDTSPDSEPEEFSAEHILSKLRNAPDRPFDAVFGSRNSRDRSTTRESPSVEVDGSRAVTPGSEQAAAAGAAMDAAVDEPTPEVRTTESSTESVERTDMQAAPSAETPSERKTPPKEPVAMPEEEPQVVREVTRSIEEMETKTRRMLTFYREHGPASAQNAHFAAGGDGDRTLAYARNRTLRTCGLVEHVGRGRYDYHLSEYLASELELADSAVIDAYVSEIETLLLE